MVAAIARATPRFSDDSKHDNFAPTLPEIAKAEAAASEGASAFDSLSTLLHEYSTLQKECVANKATIHKQKKDLCAIKKRESAASSAAKQAKCKIATLQNDITKRDQTIADQKKQLQGPAPFVPPPAPNVPSQRTQTS